MARPAKGGALAVGGLRSRGQRQVQGGRVIRIGQKKDGCVTIVDDKGADAMAFKQQLFVVRAA